MLEPSRRKSACTEKDDYKSRAEVDIEKEEDSVKYRVKRMSKNDIENKLKQDYKKDTTQFLKDLCKPDKVVMEFIYLQQKA